MAGSVGDLLTTMNTRQAAMGIETGGASGGSNMGAYAFIAGSAAKVVSTIAQGRIADSQSKVAKALADRNARVLEADAKARRMKARFDQRRQVQQAQRIKGALTAKLGASGAMLSEGAPLDLIVAQAAELELDNLLIGYAGEVDAARLEDQAGMTRLGGRFARDRGRNIKRASYMKAGTSLLSDFSTAKQERIV